MSREMGENFDKQTELANCNFVKTVLMIIVVSYHCLLFWTGNWFVEQPAFSSEVLVMLSQWMNSFHIYGFTLVSGYLFFYLMHEKMKYPKFVPFVFNKSKRLLVPYVFVSAVWVIPFAVYFFKYSGADILQRFALGVSPNQLWFLLMLFGVFAIFYPLSNFFKNHTVYGAIAVALLYGVGIVGQSAIPNVFQIFSACRFVLFFWLGFKMRQFGSQWLRKIPALIWLLADISLFVLLQYVKMPSGMLFTLIYMGLEFLLRIVGALMAFVVLQKLADRLMWKDSKVFGVLSKNAMPVYLFHQQIVYVFLCLLNGMLNPYIHAAVNFVGVMGVSLLLSMLMAKFRWTRFLIGEK